MYVHIYIYICIDTDIWLWRSWKFRGKGTIYTYIHTNVYIILVKFYVLLVGVFMCFEFDKPFLYYWSLLITKIIEELRSDDEVGERGLIACRQILPLMVGCIIIQAPPAT